MRILQNALALARINGIGAGTRHARAATRYAIAALLDELAALLQLWRARLLRK